jgi:hypothetical protein
MRFATLGGLVSACLGMLVVPAASAAPATKAPGPLLAPYSVHDGPGLRPPRGRSGNANQLGCKSDTNPYFIGISGSGQLVLASVAGSYSAVLSGYSNEACSSDDAIGAGDLNIIGGAGDGGASAGSFVGGGVRNWVLSNDALVGAGEGNTVNGSHSFVGAGVGNVESGYGSFVGAGNSNSGGGTSAFVGAGDDNTGSGSDSFVGAGLLNKASGESSFSGAGYGNIVSGFYSFVGAGYYNSAGGESSSVGGGFFNNAQGNGSFIGAGDYLFNASCAKSCTGVGNTVTGVDSFIGAGDQNSVGANEAFVGGGSDNTIAESAQFGTIAGGHLNVVSGGFAMIPGGVNNTAAGELSLAAGFNADAIHTGSFVWSDYVPGSPVVRDSAAGQFVVRASGGTYVYSSENLTAGVKLAAGSGTWASLSDRNAKTDVAPLDDAAVLAKVATLPVSIWRYKTESGVRHVGPMAQDFYKAFGVGEDDRHITSIDEDGIALSAIKALHADVVKVHAENVNLRAENASLRDRLAALERKVDALTSR